MATTHPEFEFNAVGDLKRRIWEASDTEIDRILTEDYEVPSPGEIETPGCYIQMTHVTEQQEKLARNDVVLIPLGSSELHGPHSVPAQDTLQVTRLVEAVRRHTAKRGNEVNLAHTPWSYGNHPKHHIGMIGTIPISPGVLERQLVDVMFGLWSQGYRKMIFVNNHAQHWIIASAIDIFALRYPELPFFAVAYDWCAAMAEFFRTEDRGGPFEEDFIHADESETSLALLLAPETVEMGRAVDTEPRGYLPDGHFNKSAQSLNRPNLWWSVRNNTPLEFRATPEGVVGNSTKAAAAKAKRPVAAALEYLTLLIDDILEAFPPGTTPPVEEVTLFSRAEIEGYLKKPGEPGYLNPYRLWRPFE
ncbi:MAG TPA: 3-dehydro-scyllo-inosose hydrolase [Acidimicrobiia bacterium]|nr:3-dehydro-scyllo-inosose hydrolase [Acidimicrobiia bacterium]